MGGPRARGAEGGAGGAGEKLERAIIWGRDEIPRTIPTEARKIIPQYGIELVDVRIKRLDFIESVSEKVYARMISERSASPPSSAQRGKDGVQRSSGSRRRSCARSAPP